KMYFADHGAEPEETYAAVCTQIADIQAAIAANNAKIAEMKADPAADTEVEVEAEETATAEKSPVEEAPVEEAADDSSASEESTDDCDITG
ncbi:MAG: hypothetical protein LIO45_04095, partial [Clostridiales bacterium]|nr:hypothetical protein [Clostridiales bacterium]